MPKALESAAAQIREIDGIASVSVEFDGPPPWGLGEEPIAWRADIHMRATPRASNLTALTAEVAAVLSSVTGTAVPRGILMIPLDARGTLATLEFAPHLEPDSGVKAPARVAETMRLLGTVAGVRGVSAVYGRPEVHLEVGSPAQWSEMAATLRRLPGFGVGDLSAVGISAVGIDAEITTSEFSGEIALGASSPTPALIQMLSELAARDGVRSMSYRLARQGADMSYSRASLWISVSSEAEMMEVTALLVQPDVANGLAPGEPRPEFVVGLAAGPYADRSGYLGVPLGSGEPDDLPVVPTLEPTREQVLAESDADVVVLEPTSIAARLEADLSAVDAILAAAGDAAGIRGVVSASTAECASGLGQQVHGSVVIPIFEIADSAQDAFDAIIAEWSANGFSRSDRAMGTDFYSVDDSQALGAHRLSIRGTTEGISISADGACIAAQ